MATTQEITVPQTIPAKKTGSIKLQRFIGKSLAILMLTLGASLVMMPLVWMISTSLKSEDEASSFPIEWIPQDVVKVNLGGSRSYFLYNMTVDGEVKQLAMFKKQPGNKAIFVDPANPEKQYVASLVGAERVQKFNLHWDNYVRAMTQVPFLAYLVNTMKIVLPTTIGTLASCILVAYGFSRFRAPGLNFFFLILLSTIMLPSQVTLIPTFVLFQRLGWYDTFWPLIIPSFFANAWNVFLLRQFFMSVPIEMDEAAKIDGASPLGVLWHILLPQAWPALATVAIFHFLWTWNDFFGPLIYIQSQSNWTVALGLQSFRALYTRNLTGLMAASTVTMLPCLLLFFFAQKLFIQGVVVSGIKG
jgi:multiple sugar transport system permease protein